MKKNDRMFSQYGLSFDGKRKYFNVVRRGESGEAVKLLNKEQRYRIDNYCKEGLIRLGSDFPYDEEF